MEELNISELIAKPLFAEGGIGDRLFKAYHAYAEDYILATEGPDYAPTEFERELIEDFINGLFSDEQFLAPIRALLSSAEAREEADGREWFWRIVDADGLADLPSDEEDALRLLIKRLQQAEARVERTIRAADAILARVTMVAGRYLYDAPSENLVPVLAAEGVELTAMMFRELYNATSRDGSEIR